MNHRSIAAIAGDIQRKWKNIYFGAVPYLDAMRCLDTIKDSYGMDKADDIIVYFLGNARTFKGPDAVALKDELKAILKARA